MELEYYLIESMTDCIGNNGIQKTYGVEIKIKQQGIPGESISFENVYPSRKKL